MRKNALRKYTAYHIYNRGFYKQKLFLCESDYRFFMFKIAQLKEKLKIKIYICCLMPNHYHFLIRCGQNPDVIPKFMHRLLLCYAKYFNNKYENSGHVFQGPYQNKTISNKGQFKHVYNYIKENPVEAKLVKLAENWPYAIEYVTV